MRFHLVLPPFALAFALACGGGGGGDIQPTGTLTLRLGADSIPGCSQAVVSLAKVEGSRDGASWSTLGNVAATYDLMALQNGHSAVILASAKVPAGAYNQFRLTWDSVNHQSNINLPAYVVPTAGPSNAMAMPVATVVSGAVTVPANGTAQAQLMLSGQQAIQFRAGAASPYVFQATGSFTDLAASARITGHLGDGATPLSGVEVFAESVDGNLLAAIQRRALTDASGNFVLEGLPTGGVYYVAAQPAGATSAYGALTAAPVSAAAATTYTADLAFSAPSAPGSLTVTLTPPSAATEGTWVELRQTLLTGPGVGQALIVRSGIVATSATQDQVVFQGLAPGVYGLKALRSVNGAAPVAKVGNSQQIVAGAAGAANLTLP